MGPATIPVTNPTTTRTSTSSNKHYSISLATLTVIFQTHPQTTGYTNITASNSTPPPQLAQATHTTTSTTTTSSFFEPVTFPKTITTREKSSIRKSSCITTPKGRPSTLYIFPSRDNRLKRHKNYSLPFKQLQTGQTTTPSSSSKSSTSISTTAATSWLSLTNITSS